MNWKRAAIAVLAAAPLIALFAYGFSRDPAEIPSPLPGHAAPEFTLAVFAPGEGPPCGRSVILSDFASSWAKWSS